MQTFLRAEACGREPQLGRRNANRCRVFAKESVSVIYVTHVYITAFPFAGGRTHMCRWMPSALPARPVGAQSPASWWCNSLVGAAVPAADWKECARLRRAVATGTELRARRLPLQFLREEQSRGHRSQLQWTGRPGSPPPATRSYKERGRPGRPGSIRALACPARRLAAAAFPPGTDGAGARQSASDTAAATLRLDGPNFST